MVLAVVVTGCKSDGRISASAAALVIGHSLARPRGPLSQILRGNAVNEITESREQLIDVVLLLHHARAEPFDVAVDALMILPVALDRVLETPHALIPVVASVCLRHSSSTNSWPPRTAESPSGSTVKRV